ncbi:MAG: fibronectin type III domain-containing protein [Frankiaceae bacterium]
MRAPIVIVAAAAAIPAALLAAVGPFAAADVAVAADTSPPTQPGTITVSGLTSSSASLKWGGSTDNVKVEGYRVLRGAAGAPASSLVHIATTDAVTSYSATNLRSGTAYQFGVAAIDLDGNVSAVRTVVLTTATSADTTAPAAPSSSSVVARAFSSSRIDVQWAASSSSDVAGYEVWRDGALVATTERPAGPRYSDNGLAAASSHSYAISAYDSAGNVSAPTTARTGRTTAAGVVQIVRGPYLEQVTATTAMVAWWTNVPTPATVTYTAQSTKTVTASANVLQHVVKLTGLQSGHAYSYVVGNGAGVVSATASFTTAPKPGTPFSFAVVGDFGGGSSGESQVAARIAGAGTSFIQTVGDNVYPTTGDPDPDFVHVYSDFDQRLYKPYAAALAGQSFNPANGNKEYYGYGAFWRNIAMPGNQRWYSYDWGDAHILVLDSEQPLTAGSPQYVFAQSDLAAHQSQGWRIAVLQRPAYSSTSANSSSVPVRSSLVPLFQSQHVDLVLSGNSHNYERTFPLLDGAPVTTGGITYVVSGAGGNGFNAFTIAAPSWSAFREASYYQFVKVSVSATSLRVDAVRGDTGAVFDTATITR